MASSSSANWELVTIGRGSFASVHVLTGRPVAFKAVLDSSRTNELHREFAMLCELYQARDRDSIFSFTCPIAYHDSESPDGFTDSGGAQRFSVSIDDLQLLNFPTAVFAMDHVIPLPPSTAKSIRQFYPAGSDSAPDPSLCRLYFGKEIQVTGQSGRPHTFFNSSNFPLDSNRYRHITIPKDCYVTPEKIAFGMGQTISRIHWHMGYDARDIEFVLGGRGFSDVGLYVIDFNQMRHWSKDKADVPALVNAHYANDPYYPCARNTDTLYTQFKAGYMSACPETAYDAATAFLEAIETEQHKRDVKIKSIGVS
ncbi:hypothetical protein BD410DRAFT_781914 [Rickenella mellea]|uniref:DUF3669 domain-containing protein n=1 Tax=Rickenella mellea TaxID=50990 RepID=A0A4Y7QLN4_9AGAM|nr:hypothetical protein BD410DRAFT_781914 [Rickenella mellea]